MLIKGKLRSALCGLIYNKTLLLNISANSAVNVGRILTLISSDCRMIGEMARLFDKFFFNYFYYSNAFDDCIFSCTDNCSFSICYNGF
jgi:hypothetical protein